MRRQISQLHIGTAFGCRMAAALCLSAMLCLGLSPMLPAFAEEEPAHHVHTESCYSTEPHLVCGQEEGEGHQHSEDCWGMVRGDLVCADNTWEHVHGDECYEWVPGLVCGLEEGEGAHTHTEDCWSTESVLICGEEEWTDEQPAGEEEPIWEPEEPEEEPVFGPGDGIVSMIQAPREMPFAAQSDPTADLEDEETWWRMFSGMELSGNWAEDLIMVAESQLGYTESLLNYDAEDPSNPKGYTRYGAWYGIPYGEWCAMFISFCLYYAEIPSTAIPYNCHCSEWVRELSIYGLYRNWDEGYSPRRGDLIFFDFDSDEKADHVGIITDVDEGRGWIYTIEGNRYDYVESYILTVNDYSIIGYAALPENPNYDPENPGVERQNGRVELPPDPVEPEPPSWDTILDAAAGIKSVSITPSVESSRAFS